MMIELLRRIGNLEVRMYAMEQELLNRQVPVDTTTEPARAQKKPANKESNRSKKVTLVPEMPVVGREGSIWDPKNNITFGTSG